MKKLFFLALTLLPSVALGATFSHNLSLGTTGTDVSSLQQFLSDEHLYGGPITATLGPNTQSALVKFQLQQGIAATGFFGPASRAAANTILNLHPEWTTNVTSPGYYKNVSGNSVLRPGYSSKGIPAGATAQCGDGTFSFSLSHRGTCSHHGGVARWR
jgi:peptidoglycan hydrolase-like protein with peptidoglycan-binding domain